MRSLATVSMMIGSMVLSFAAVVFVIAFLGIRFGTGEGLAARYTLGVEALVIGAVLCGVGFVMSRVGRRTRDTTAPEGGTT